MPTDDRLGFHLGFLIVSKALDGVSAWDHITLDTPLKQVLPNRESRQRFNTAVYEAVRAYGVSETGVTIKLPGASHRTIGDITAFISGLPGKSGTGDSG